MSSADDVFTDLALKGRFSSVFVSGIDQNSSSPGLQDVLTIHLKLSLMLDFLPDSSIVFCGHLHSGL